MAYTIQDTNTASFRIPLVRDGEETSRTLTIPNVNTAGLSIADYNNALALFRSDLSAVEGYATAFQPTNWRDEDITEDEWTLRGGVSAITLEVTSTTKSTFN